MNYDYIRNHYGVEVTVSQMVQHNVTGRFGVVMPEIVSAGHYVQVLFNGDKRMLPCHPTELEFVDDL